MFAVVPEAVTLGESAVGTAVASNVGKKIISKAPQILPQAERIAATELGAAKNLIGKGASTIENVASKATEKAAIKGAEGAAKESTKKKVFDAVVLGGVLPGVGFTAASNYLSKPSSDSNPDIKNGDLVEAHEKANGNHEKLMNHKFDNGKKFKDVQNDFVKNNKSVLNKANGEKDLLYNDSGSPTNFHKKALLHGIKLDKK